MADNQNRLSSSPSKSLALPSRPTISLPPRASMETLLNGTSGFGGFGFSPGPITLVSSFFSDSDNCKSFSQLLAGAMASPEGKINDSGGFKQNRPGGLVIAPSPSSVFTIPPGLSPAGLLDSPGLFSPGQGPFGMTHQQALAQVTALAAQAHPHIHQTEYYSSAPAAPELPSSNSNSTADKKIQSQVPNSGVSRKESSDISQSDEKSENLSCTADRAAEDGYNWRKYGQKQVKGSEFPRGYYKCTHPNCHVKKKVERSFEGEVTEIIYKGQHNHERPKPNKRAKDAGNFNGTSNMQGKSEPPVRSGGLGQPKEGKAAYSTLKRDQESSQATAEQLSGVSDGEELEETASGVNGKDEDELDSKRRCTEVRVSESSSSHRTVTEPRIIVQTTSEVDLLDDGYRWRKYGQKVVKGNPYPRSYYKCTTPGCNVRKHVERAAKDPEAVITTYEGKHNHEVPAARTSSHSMADNNTSQNSVTLEKSQSKSINVGNIDKRAVGHLRLKEEQIT